MPPRKLENYINDDGLSRLIAKESRITIKAVRELREAQDLIIKTLLKRGKVITLGDIGKFSLYEHKERKGREFKMPKTGEITWIEPKPAYQTPYFKFHPNFKEDIKKATTEVNIHG